MGRKTSVTIILAILAFAAPATALVGSTPTPIGSILSHVPRGPIVIESDADFCGDALGSGVVNCASADGSAERPFEISGWSIQASRDLMLPAITIRHTTLHAVVRGNNLMTGSVDTVPTVVLENVQNVALVENVLRSGRAPALAVDGLLGAPEGAATHPAIRGNMFIAGLVDGPDVTLVTMRNAHGVVVRDSSFLGTRDSADDVAELLSIHASEGVTLIDDFFSSIAGTALLVTDSRDVDVLTTQFETVARAIEIYRTPGVAIAGVRINQTAEGIRSVDAGNLLVASSAVEDNYPCVPACLATFGLDAVGTSLFLAGTSFRGFDTGLRFNSSEVQYLVVTCNLFADNAVGAEVFDNGTETFFNNSLVGNPIALRNTGPSRFHADDNWWGDAAGPAPGSLQGKFEIEDFLASPPSCAPSA